MRIVLINPPIDSVLEHGHVSPVTKYLFYNSAPLGILYIAAVLEQEGHVVSVIDAAAELLNIEKTTQRVCDFQPDFIGLGSFTVTFSLGLFAWGRSTVPHSPGPWVYMRHPMTRNKAYRA